MSRNEYATRKEALVCKSCGRPWMRDVVRGRKPSFCAECKEKNEVQFQESDGGRFKEAYVHETKDCTVRALALATGAPYSEAHAFLAEQGRRFRHGINFYTVMQDNEYHILDTDFTYGRIIRSRGLRTALIRNPQLREGTWVLKMPRHVATIKDGILMDSFDSTRKEINGAWKVVE